MSHLVIYETDGSDRYERFDSLDEAVALVERLRNDGSNSARIFRLEEIQFEVKAYYRVEIGPAPPPVVSVHQEPAYEAPQASPLPEAAAEPMSVEAVLEEIETEAAPIAVAASEPVEQVVGGAGPGTGHSEPDAEQSEEYAVSNTLGGARRGLFGR